MRLGDRARDGTRALRRDRRRLGRGRLRPAQRRRRRHDGRQGVQGRIGDVDLRRQCLRRLPLDGGPHPRHVGPEIRSHRGCGQPRGLPRASQVRALFGEQGGADHFARIGARGPDRDRRQHRDGVPRLRALRDDRPQQARDDALYHGDARRRVVHFPWTLSYASKYILPAIPDFLYDWLAHQIAPMRVKKPTPR